MTHRTESNARRHGRRGEKRNRRRPGQMAIPRLHSKPINVCLFAGGGGSTLGMEMAGLRVDVAVNHDPEAVAVHAHNHPNTEHRCESVFDTTPHAVCRGRRVGCLWASPDCTDHSKAKGDKPRSSGRRALAWVVYDWARDVQPDVILAENVEEFADWGPLLDTHHDDCGDQCADDCRFGRRDNSRKGESYVEWRDAIVALGYRYAARDLRACDYGAPTTRKRRYMVFVHESLNREPTFPEPTHGPGLLPYATAADCIDFSIPCPSIFLSKDEVRELGLKCKRPLADKTMRRVARGIWKYVIRSARPFIVPVTHSDPRVHSVDEPLPTVTCAHRGEFAVVAPALNRYNGTGVGQRLDEPMATVTTKDRFAVIAPTLVQTGYGERQGQEPRSLDLHQPLGTVVSCGVKHAVVSAFLAKHYSDRPTGGWPGGSSLENPVGTVTVRDHHSLVTTNLVKMYGTSTGADVRQPTPTVTATGNHLGEVRTLLERYPANDDETLDQVVWIDGVGYVIVDIGLRMLIARELFRANGFPDSYDIDIEIDGEQLSAEAKVRLVGNAVVPIMAQRMAEANCAHLIERQRAA